VLVAVQIAACAAAAPKRRTAAARSDLEVKTLIAVPMNRRKCSCGKHILCLQENLNKNNTLALAMLFVCHLL
jgi:hypothetical protein